MSSRPANGRIRGHHSFAGAIAVGVLIASIAVVIFALVGGFRP